MDQAKLDLIVFVNAKNETLHTLEATASLPFIAETVAALEKMHQADIFALRSFCDISGAEIRTEILTPSALASAVQDDIALVLVEIWHANRPDFFANREDGIIFEKELFSFKANLLVTKAVTIEEMLDSAYHHSQNINYGWNPLGGSRSSSVGDIFVAYLAGATPQAFRILGAGFHPVTLD